MYHFYRIKFQFLTDSTDFKKPCERKAKNAFAHVCKICIYAKFAYMQITSMCTGFVQQNIFVIFLLHKPFLQKNKSE